MSMMTGFQVPFTAFPVHKLHISAKKDSDLLELPPVEMRNRLTLTPIGS